MALYFSASNLLSSDTGCERTVHWYRYHAAIVIRHSEEKAQAQFCGGGAGQPALEKGTCSADGDMNLL